ATLRKIPCVGREKMVVFDDRLRERRVTVYDRAPWHPPARWGEWQTRSGDIFSPEVPNAEPLRLECLHFLDLVAGNGDRLKPARDGLAVVQALEQLQSSLVAAPA